MQVTAVIRMVEEDDVRNKLLFVEKGVSPHSSLARGFVWPTVLVVRQGRGETRVTSQLNGPEQYHS